MTQSPCVLVTGASRGIGAACARLAARHGYDVAISFLNDERAAAAVVADIEAAGRRALAVRADNADEAQTLALFARIDEVFGRLDAFVNNAGILPRAQGFLDYDLARLKRVFDTNLVGCIVAAREAVRRMSTRQGGRGGAIVNLSSAAARIGGAGEFLDYAASKGALDTFTIGLAKEFAAEGIRVNAVRPGLIHTDIHASAGEPGRVERLQVGVPMQRGGTAEEVAEAVIWLLSAQAGYVTGTLMDVTGGR